MSTCRSYEADFDLFSLLYDIDLAKTLTSLIHVADRQKISPEDAATSKPSFDVYWQRESEKLTDLCRQMGEFPNLFFTLAPAEWNFEWHRALFREEEGDGIEAITARQATFAIHMHHVIGSILQEIGLKQGEADAAKQEF